MKIGLVLDDSLDRPDGVQQYVTALGDWLLGQGHEVVYLCGETKRRDLNVRSLSRNINVRFNKNRLSLPWPVTKARLRRVLDEQFDVLHVQLPCTPWLAGRIVRQAAATTAVVGTFHIAPYSPLVTRASQVLGLALRPVMQRFDSVISVSPPAQAFARQTLRVSSQVIPNMVELETLKTGRAKPINKPTLVYLGRLVPRKGVHQLLKAVDELVHHYRLDFQLLIGGSGPLEASLRRYVSRQGLEKYVSFLGYIDEADKADFLAGGDIAVFPSLGGESFGIVLIEAMAAGAGVVLGGNNPGYASVLGELPETLFDPNNTKQLAGRLQQLLTSPTRRRQLGQRQSAYVRQFDVGQVGPRIMAVYELAIAKR